MLDAIFADIFNDGEWRKTRTRVVLSPKETHKYDIASQVDADGVGDAVNDELKGLPVVRGSRNPTVGYVYQEHPLDRNYKAGCVVIFIVFV